MESKITIYSILLNTKVLKFSEEMADNSFKSAGCSLFIVEGRKQHI